MKKIKDKQKWNIFLLQVSEEVRLKSAEKETFYFAFEDPDKEMEMKEISEGLYCDLPALKSKSRLGGIYKKLSSKYPELSGRSKGKLKILRNSLLEDFRKNYIDRLEWVSLEFKNLIESHIVDFVGREFISDEFFEFTRQNDRGYFTIVGAGGSGKTSIAANFVYQNSENTLVYFCDRSNTSKESFIDSVKNQASLQYTESDFNGINDVSTLLSLISEKLPSDSKIVLVLDFLYRHSISEARNLFGLPRYMPPKVYCLLLRNPYVLETKHLLTESPTKIIDLHDYRNKTQKDMVEYLQNTLNSDSEFEDLFKRHIEQNEIKHEQLIEKFISEVGDSFRYLKEKIKDVKKDQKIYLKKLPEGLCEYYKLIYIESMNIKGNNTKKNVIKKLIEKENQFINLENLAGWLDEDEIEIYRIALEWSEYLLTNTENGTITSFKIRDSILFEILKSQKAY